MSAGQGIGAVVGATIGFFVGGPAGALYGAQIGAAVGGYLDPPKGPTVQGPRLSDLAVQTSTYGAFIPRVYGTIGIHGNLLWLENNQLKETVRKKKQGGKGGGGSTTVKTYSYSATFILALCQGPIAGVRRIWCGDKLIYNAGSDDLETIIASNQAAQGWRLYLGTDDQLPDTRYEADVGVGNASAFRGIAYLAFYDFQLADYGNTLQAAQFKVEVVSSSGRLTTVLTDLTMPGTTPVDWESGLAMSPEFTGAHYLSTRQVNSGEIRSISLGSAQPKPELFSLTGNDPLTLVRGCVSYDGDMWYTYKTTDIFGSRRFNRISDGRGFTINADNNAYGFRRAANSDEEIFVCIYDSAGSNLFGSAGRLSIEAGIEIITTSKAATAGYMISTAGTSVHEVRVSGDQFSIKTFTDNFAALDAWTVEIPGAPVSDILGPLGSDGVGAHTCVIGDQFYICEATVGGYRIFVFDQQGEVDSYIVEASTVGDEIYAFLMIDETSGYIANRNIFVQFKRYAAGAYALSEIIANECGLSSLLTEADVDASQLIDSVSGYRVTGGTIRAALEPLQGAFPFDVIQSGYQIKCVPRGQSPVATIPWEDLGATDSDTPGDLLQQSREMDTQLPARTTIKYLDAAREYATSEQYAERINTEAVNRVDRELPLVLTADEAAGVAEVLQFLPWLERTDAAFSLPPTYLHLEPSDVVTAQTPGATYQLRLTEINYTPDGRLECKAKPNRAALYTPNATGGEGVPPSGNVPLLGPTLWLPLDIPVVDETIQNSPGFATLAAGSTSGWPGAVAFRSLDSGQTWSDLQGYTGVPTVGNARGTLPASACTLIDQRSLVVDLIAGELESITRDQMLAGQNYAAYGADGRWEIVRFQNATLQGDGSYLVSHFVRGERGTEWATGLHQADDYFVLLDDPDNVFIDMAVGSIGVPATYRGVTLGSSIDSAPDVPFTYQGVNLECLSPVYARGTRDGSSNFSGTFTRRSRLSSSWWANGVEAPLGETTHAYEIDVMSGATVKRTISVASPAWSYSAADQTADFGSTQASITFRIHQLSSVVGRGYPLEVTL